MNGPATPHNQPSIRWDSYEGRTTDLVRRTSRKYHYRLRPEAELPLTPKHHKFSNSFNIGNQHQLHKLDTLPTGDESLQGIVGYFMQITNGWQWFIKTMRCLDTLAVMVIRGVMILFSRGTIASFLMFLFITILSALLCTHDITKTAVQAPVINNNIEGNYDVLHENTQPKESWLEIEYITQDDLADQIGQYKKTIDNLRNEVNLIRERCTKAEIQLMKQVNLGFETLETNHNLEMKREIDKIQETTRKLIKQELNLYEADKIGIVDFALQVLGGRIVHTLDTEQYTSRYLDLGIFKLPLTYAEHSVWNIIQPSVELGECWAFVGSTGKVIIKLATLVRIRGVTLEHISSKIALFGMNDSAPKEFTILGMNGPKIEEGVETLGSFQYDSQGQQRQSFWGNVSRRPYRFIMLWIESNHGNTKYTCVYRFRVHGEPMKDY